MLFNENRAALEWHTKLTDKARRDFLDGLRLVDLDQQCYAKNSSEFLAALWEEILRVRMSYPDGAGRPVALEFLNLLNTGTPHPYHGLFEWAGSLTHGQRLEYVGCAMRIFKKGCV